MKKMFFVFCIIALIFPALQADLFANHLSLISGGNPLLRSDPHDSLLFDAADNFSPGSSAVKCPIVVKYISGIGEGTIVHTKAIMICGKQDSEVTTEKGVVKENDILNVGDEISTGPGAFMQIEFPDGSEIKMAPNSKIIVDKSWCESYGISALAGDIMLKLNHLLKDAKYEVKTGTCAVGNRGTTYTINTKYDGGDTSVTVRVYDGSVEMIMNQMDLDETAQIGAKIELLNKDLQAGKITQDEYMKKMQEYSKQVNTNDERKQKTNAIVKAGNMCIATRKTLGEVTPISSDDKWFEANFPKK